VKRPCLPTIDGGLYAFYPFIMFPTKLYENGFFPKPFDLMNLILTHVLYLPLELPSAPTISPHLLLHVYEFPSVQSSPSLLLSTLLDYHYCWMWDFPSRVEMASCCWLFGMALELDCVMGFSSWCFGTIQGSNRRTLFFLAGSRLSRSQFFFISSEQFLLLSTPSMQHYAFPR
jgi:hypothetical protein